MELEVGFNSPPDSARPQTFWHWMNGNVTKEGITADLGAMKDAGMGGVFLYSIEGHITESTPQYVSDPVYHLTPEWLEMVRHAVSECERLGLELSLMNCPGWTTAGGTWIPPDKSSMRIAWSERIVTGPEVPAGSVPKPPCDFSNYQNLTTPQARRHMHESVPPERRFYRDVAVLAYRMEAEAAHTARMWPPKVSCSESGQDASAVLDGDGSTRIAFAEGGYLRLEFNEPATVRAMEYQGSEGELQASDDGESWRTVTRIPAPRNFELPLTIAVPETKARLYRLSYASAKSHVSHVELTGESRVHYYQPKAGFNMSSDKFYRADDKIGPSTPGSLPAAVQVADILDITELMLPDGTINWTVPEGTWRILRIGYAPIGRLNGPVARQYAGLECDKLSAPAVDFHFNAYTGRVADTVREMIGTGFHYAYVDSYEAWDASFTPRFVEEFRDRRGYDPTPYLPVHAGGCVVESPEVSERFLWDVRRTIADLLADNFYGRLAYLSHKRGLKFQAEAAGVNIPATVDQLQVKGRCDIPMGEFQLPNPIYHEWWARWDPREAASAAHIYGKPIVAVEAWTSFDRWMSDPFGLKGSGDLAYAMGANRLVFHTYAHQPFLDRVPGMTMGPFGVNFSRTNTWWGRPAKAWIGYLRRCEFMLQQGRHVADILFFYGEGAPNTLPKRDLIRPLMPHGYQYDGCNAEVLLSRVRVRNGKLTMPDGNCYRLLVLPEEGELRITPRVMKKLRELVRKGARLLGARPYSSASLSGYPKCDEQVRKIAEELWGPLDGKTVTEHAFGKGRVYWDSTVAEVLAKMGVDPDVDILRAEGGIRLEWLHRSTGDADSYFLSNQGGIMRHGATPWIHDYAYECLKSLEPEEETAVLEVAFRVGGKRPEMWDAVSGGRRFLPEYTHEGERTVVPLTLAPMQSCFIVFRSQVRGGPETETGGRNFPALKTAMVLEDSWTVTFEPERGGPGKVEFSELQDWTERPEEGIRYYSGRAVYEKRFDISADLAEGRKRIILDLGTVRSVADILINGNDLGVVWCAPWRVDVTGYLKPANNVLEIGVTNVWANRLIGDASKPEEQRITWTSRSPAADEPLIPSGLRGPVTLKTEE